LGQLEGWYQCIEYIDQLATPIVQEEEPIPEKLPEGIDSIQDLTDKD
jgi:hypothetical protein